MKCVAANNWNEIRFRLVVPTGVKKKRGGGGGGPIKPGIWIGANSLQGHRCVSFFYYVYLDRAKIVVQNLTALLWWRSKL